ncbi:MAG TPA: hypothetical protein VFM74_06530 [Candidatus Limnocylindria bacterium]|nr:hypothetical protein [Candidatus Limnocylindria bacterium]
MRLIRPAAPDPGRRAALARALGMVVVGAIALTMLLSLPRERPSAMGALALAAALGLGIGGASLLRAARRPEGLRRAEDLGRLIGPAFDDAYALIVEPRLPGVAADLAALLVGPGGVRALLVRDWDGRYRVRGRGWEFDARGRRGWIACRTNPSFDGQALSDAVARWARDTDVDPNLPISPAIVFPYRHSRLVLEEPDEEVVTWDNAPWWAQRVGKVQRLDPPRVARIVEAVMAASESAVLKAAPTARQSAAERS